MLPSVRFAGLEAKLAAANAELSTAKSTIALLQEGASQRETLEQRVHAREHEIVSQTEELEHLRHDVVRLSQELGQQRGRADALASQARNVARLEAEEIARLEDQLNNLRQVWAAWLWRRVSWCLLCDGVGCACWTCRRWNESVRCHGA